VFVFGRQSARFDVGLGFHGLISFCFELLNTALFPNEQASRKEPLSIRGARLGVSGRWKGSVTLELIQPAAFDAGDAAVVILGADLSR
jgi:hypothetical protein